MKRNDAEPQRESRSVEDTKKLTKVLLEKKEKNCLQKSRLAPSFEGEKKREKWKRESPSNQSQWTRWRERVRERGDYQNRAFRSSFSTLDICCFSFSLFFPFSFLFFLFSPLFIFFSRLSYFLLSFFGFRGENIIIIILRHQVRTIQISKS